MHYKSVDLIKNHANLIHRLCEEANFTATLTISLEKEFKKSTTWKIYQNFYLTHKKANSK